MIALCHHDEIEEASSKGFEINGKAYFAVKHDGQVYVYENRCPHLGIELNWQEDQFLDAEGCLIQCATHGALFLMDTGQCVAGPCQGKHLSAIPCELQEGMISVQLSAPE